HAAISASKAPRMLLPPALEEIWRQPADNPRRPASNHVRAPKRSVSGRRQGAAGQGAIGRWGRSAVLAADIIGIGDAPQTAGGGGGLALLVAGEGAVAQARLLVALNAERIARPDRVGRRAAKNRKAARRQQNQNRSTHSKLHHADRAF